MLKTVIISLILLANINYFGQSKCCSSKSWGLSAGISQPTSPIIEVGFGRNASKGCGTFSIGAKRYCLWRPFGGFLINGEYNLIEDIKGVSTSFWVNSGIAFGVNFNYYSKDTLTHLGLKPMIGLEFFGVSLYYGRNFKLSDNTITGINKNTIGLKYYLPFKNKK
jgi:hypothetical protein